MEKQLEKEKKLLEDAEKEKPKKEMSFMERGLPEAAAAAQSEHTGVPTFSGESRPAAPARPRAAKKKVPVPEDKACCAACAVS